MADIDLSGYTYDRAVIAPDTNDITWAYAGTPFGGVFDGDGHTISHLTIRGGSYLGLFGVLDSSADISHLGLDAVDVNGTGGCIGGLLGSSGDWLFLTGVVIDDCHSAGTVSGRYSVGGLVGENYGSINTSYSTGAVSGEWEVGGLAGSNIGSITASYSTAAVIGEEYVGGLLGYNLGKVLYCYAVGNATGDRYVGGLVGCFGMDDWMPDPAQDPPYGFFQCYAAGAVTLSGEGPAGGLIGECYYPGITSCLWDTQISGQTESHEGTGLTTAEMRDPNTLGGFGWDFVGRADGPHDIWVEPEGGGYPILYWQVPPDFGLPTFSGGRGEPNSPYLISTPDQLNSIGYNPRLMSCHFKLLEDVDLIDTCFHPMGGQEFPYEGGFDGNGHVISHLTLEGEGPLGLFVVLGSKAHVKNLGVLDVNLVGTWFYVGGLVGISDGALVRCYTTGMVRAYCDAGGLIGNSRGSVTGCYSTATVSGDYSIGGLLGTNRGGLLDQSFCAGSSRCTGTAGGLVGSNGGTVSRCYSTATVSGANHVGGLVGGAYDSSALVYHCYSAGKVSGGSRAGGVQGDGWPDCVVAGFWDIETSGKDWSAGGTGLTTTEMQTASTFLEAGWDFIDETENGTDDIWWILEGQDYPRLWWELIPEN